MDPQTRLPTAFHTFEARHQDPFPPHLAYTRNTILKHPFIFKRPKSSVDQRGEVGVDWGSLFLETENKRLGRVGDKERMEGRQEDREGRALRSGTVIH